MRHSYRALLITILLDWGGMPVPALAEDHLAEVSSPCEVISLSVDNDAFGGTDRDYTGGLRLACTTSAPQFIHNRLLSDRGADASVDHRATYAIGQSIFTPDDLAASAPLDDKHPYAGWLYLGFALEREVIPKSDRRRYLDNIELQLGVIGPLSGAEQLQRSTHDLLGATDPQGWDNQLDSEPGINLFYSRQWTGAEKVTLTDSGRLPNLLFDITPQLGMALGNVYAHGAGGVTFRLGNFLPDGHGPPVIRPSLPGSDYFPHQDKVSIYLFGGLEGRVVARNIFLDGNTFEDDGPSVDKKRFVGEARIGLALTYDRTRIAYTHVFRSREFDGQDPQTFGSINLSVGF